MSEGGERGTGGEVARGERGKRTERERTEREERERERERGERERENLLLYELSPIFCQYHNSFSISFMCFIPLSKEDIP